MMLHYLLKLVVLQMRDGYSSFKNKAALRKILHAAKEKWIVCISTRTDTIYLKMEPLAVSILPILEPP
jgi:hypothetical protein